MASSIKQAICICLVFIVLFSGCEVSRKEENRSSSSEASAGEAKTKSVGLKVGQVAPDIALPALDGNIMTLSSLRGRYVLIDFWASWCGPCRHENPNVVKLYQKYKSQGFEIFSVSLDRDTENWQKAVEADGLTWHHVSDLKMWESAVVPVYKVDAIPMTFLLDKEGVIIARDLRGEELEEKLEKVFAGN
jgi:peroxiredoxin